MINVLFKVLIGMTVLYTLPMSVAQAQVSQRGVQSITQAVKPIEVVATFSILADMVKQVGGDAVNVTSLVGYGSDAHVFTPTPADVRVIAQAQLVVTNGLGFEGWLNRLIGSSGYKGPVVVASTGVKPIKASPEERAGPRHSHAHSMDPHAWQDLNNAKIYVENIRQALVRIAPDQTREIDQRTQAYLAQIDALDHTTRQQFALIAPAHRIVMTSHDAFGYFAQAYDVQFLSVQGFSTEREASAAQVGELISQIRKDRVKALFIEHLTDARLIKQIAQETGAKLGGTLYVDALTPPGTAADTYLNMFASNVKTIVQALQ